MGARPIPYDREIHWSNVKEFDVLGLDGRRFLSNSIAQFQKLKYPNWYRGDFKRNPKSVSDMNHVGIYVKDKYNVLKVAEQDDPGRFQINSFREEYVKTKQDVYVLRFHDLNEELFPVLFEWMMNYAAEDKFANYSYLSFYNFIRSAIKYRLLFTDIQWRRIPKGSTCSQITARILQELEHCLGKEWWKWFPFEIAAMADEILKVIYD